MTALRKFLFDYDFEVVEKPVEITEETAAEETGPEVIDPVFKGEYLEISFDAGFDAGKEEGVREASGEIEKQVLETLAKMAENLNVIFENQKEANAAAARDAVSAALAVSRKVLPDLGERNALGEVQRMVESVLEKVIDEPRLVVRTNEQIHEQLAERIDAMRQSGNFHGDIILQACTELPVGDCRVEWGNGGAERNMESVWREIDEIIERNLGGKPESAAAEAVEPPGESAKETPGEANGVADTDETETSIETEGD